MFLKRPPSDEVHDHHPKVCLHRGLLEYLSSLRRRFRRRGNIDRKSAGFLMWVVCSFSSSLSQKACKGIKISAYMQAQNIFFYLVSRKILYFLRIVYFLFIVHFGIAIQQYYENEWTYTRKREKMQKKSKIFAQFKKK